jgi:glycosyltransferase involved in cell wall biosynthesis
MSNSTGWWGQEPFGGGEVWRVQVAKKYHEKGIKIVSIEGPPYPSIILGAKYKVFKVPIPTHKFISRRLGPLLRLLWIFMAFVPSFLYGMRSDVILTSSEKGHEIFLAYMIGKLIKRAIIISIPNETIREPKNQTLIERLIFTCLNQATAYLCMSRIVAEQCKAAGLQPKKLLISSGGVDLQMIERLQVTCKDFDVIFFGRVDERKGIFDLIKATKLINENGVHIRLIIVGSGKDLLRTKTLANKLGILNQITFVGFVTDDNKYLYLKRSKIFVLPTMWHEGFSLSVLEALACGLPSICYENAVLREVYGRCPAVILVPKGDYKKLALTVMSLLKDDESLERLSHKAKEFARGYDYEAIAEREISMLNSILVGDLRPN